MSLIVSSAIASEIVASTIQGADSTGHDDSCLALKKAFASVPVTGGSIRFNGTFISSCALEIRDRSISLRGDGPGVARLIFTSAVQGDAGISIFESGQDAGVSVEGLSIYTRVDQEFGNVALKVQYGAPSTIQKGPRFSNLDIRGEYDRSFWARGIECLHCIGGTIDDVVVSGKNSLKSDDSMIVAYNSFSLRKHEDKSGVANMDRAVSLDVGSTDFKISALHAYFANIGIFVDNGSEGVGVSQTTVVATNWGVYNGPGEVGTASQFVSQSHFNTILGGIYAPGCLERQYGPGNLFYKWTASTADWVGIDATDGTIAGKPVGCTQSLISGNIFYGFRGRAGTRGNSTGIRLGRYADWDDVSNNNATLIDTFADLSSGNGKHNHFAANSLQLVNESMRP